MASSIMFLKFDGSLPGKLANAKMRYSQEEVSSKYNPRTTNAGNAISSNLFTALKIFSGNSSREGFCGIVDDGAYVSELMSVGDRQRQLCYISKSADGTFGVQAGVTSSTDPMALSINGSYIVSTTGVQGFSGTLILLALLPEILKDEEAKNLYEELMPYLCIDENSTFWDNDSEIQKFSMTLCALTDNVYRRMKESVPPDVKLSLPSTQKGIKTFKKETILLDVIEAYGTPFFFKSPTAIGDVGDEYYLEGATSPAPIPTNFKFSKWMIDIAEMISDSSCYEESIRTAMLVGPAGTGKSLGARGIAHLLGLEYSLYTCHPDTELFDLFGQIFPKTGGEKMSFEEVRIRMGYPSVDDIINDLKGSFVKFFKKPYDGSMAESDLINEVISATNAAVADLCSNDSYVYEEGELTKALRYGHLLEIQEVGIIQRPGVAVGLNAVLESGLNAFVTLPTGERLRKHKNTIIILTSNDEYEGTANLNQSVLSRMAMCYWFKNAKVDEMVERTMSVVTDFIDKDKLREVAQIVCDITAYCKKNAICDGVCGQRELTNWAMGVMAKVRKRKLTEIDSKLMMDALKVHIIGKASQNEEDINSIISAIIEPKYGPMTIRI